MTKVWRHFTKTPAQRAGFILLNIGLISLFFWAMKRDLDFLEIFDPYYFPDSRHSFIFHLYLYFIPLGLLLTFGYNILNNIRIWVVSGSKDGEERKKTKYIPPMKTLHFSNNLDAFKFASSNFQANFEPNQMSIGLIQEKTLLNNGTYHFLVQLADTSRTVLVSGFSDKYADKLSKGNLVYWGFIDKTNTNNPWEPEAIGHIIAALSPEFDPNSKRWSIKIDCSK